jgi:alkylhydroperoxidase family enzyme
LTCTYPRSTAASTASTCTHRRPERAREAGETQQRLDCLTVWQECPFFEKRERAALAWAEALTHLSETHAPDALYETLTAYFSEPEIVELTYSIAVTNTWNRIAVGFRQLPDIRTDEIRSQAA